MQSFACDQCNQLVFFENHQCLHCGCTLAFIPERMAITAVQADTTQLGLWTPLDPAIAQEFPCIRMCNNRTSHGNACNFTTDASGLQPLCVSCRQARWLPDLSDSRNIWRWAKMENAKRYLFYTLSRLHLTVLQGVPPPLFDFLEDIPGQAPVMTGHLNGVITLNVAEADDDERARRRLALHEPYRTLLGHLRHESGHFFWDILIRDTAWLEGFRKLFGDDRQDYAQAIQTHYQSVPSNDWMAHHVSAYATAHPWEDWAETWAHYMHVMDLLETAACYQIRMRLPGQSTDSPHVQDPFAPPPLDFSSLQAQCLPLTLVLNSLNRSLGQNDAYPFSLSPGAIAKLDFVHRVVSAHRLPHLASEAP